jgi:RNA polymerase sigma-54 factor
MHGMRMDLTQRMSQQQIMAPRMIQSMEILQMPIMDLQERIQQELDENPVFIDLAALELARRDLLPV